MIPNNTLIKYIRPEISIVDVRIHLQHRPPEEIVYLKYPDIQNYIHELVFRTDLPKKLMMYNCIEGNPYHLLFYMIARFYWVDDGVSEVIYWYPNFHNSSLVNSAFNLLPKRFIRELEKDETVEYVQFPGCRWYDDFIEEDWIYEYVKNLYKEIWENTPQEKGKRIYICRNPKYNLRLRNVLNEDELCQEIKQIGFSSYDLEKLTFVDSIRLFKSAEFVTGYHGGGLAWLIFCDVNTIFCEINPWEDKNKHYKHLAEQQNLKYYHFTDVLIDNSNNKDNITVNIPQYVDVLYHLIRTA